MTGGLEIADEYPGAVAAHLGEAAIGIAVVHEELGRLDAGHGLVEMLGADDSKHSVGADPGMTIAQEAHLLGCDAAGTVEIGEHHEVVAGAMALDERHFVDRGHGATLTRQAQLAARD